MNRTKRAARELRKYQKRRQRDMRRALLIVGAHYFTNPIVYRELLKLIKSGFMTADVIKTIQHDDIEYYSRITDDFLKEEGLS